LICKLGCECCGGGGGGWDDDNDGIVIGCPCNGGGGCELFVNVIPLGLPYALETFPTVPELSALTLPRFSSVGVSVPFIILTSALVVGNIISLSASTLLIFFSPFSTSPFALLYIHNPKNVIPIPKPWTGWMDWLNQMMAMQMTATRLMREAME